MKTGTLTFVKKTAAGSKAKPSEKTGTLSFQKPPYVPKGINPRKVA